MTALALDAVAVSLLAAFVLVVREGTEGDAGTGGFFSEPLPAALLLSAATFAIAAGVAAAWSLICSPLRGRAGRWATAAAVANALVIPVVAVSVTAVAWLVGYDLPKGWGEPIVPLWLLSGLAALILGARTNDPGRRGMLVLPLMIGAAVLTFWLGEILSPH